MITNKPVELPSVVETLGVGAKQKWIYSRPLHKKTRNKTSRKRWKKLPKARQTTIWELSLDAFVATPVACHSKHEVSYFPSHGYSEVQIWFKREWFRFELNVGEGPITIPAGAPYTIKTFACMVRLHAVTASKSWPKTVLEKSARKLCKKT